MQTMIGRSATMARVGQTLLYVGLIVVSVLLVFPLLWALSTSLKSYSEVISRPYQLIPASIHLSNFSDIFKSIPFLTYLLNTVKVSTLTCLGTLVTSAMAAYAFARLKFPGRDAIFLVYLSTLMIPRQVILIPNFIIFRTFHMLDTHWPLVLTGIFTAYGTFLLRQFFLTIPRELEEAAIIDGYGYRHRFTHIVIPLSQPALVTLFIITLLNIWNEFLFALVFINSDVKRTLTLGLSILRGDFDVQWNLVMAATLLAIMPLIIVYLSAQRFFVEGIALSGVKG
ncbi:MAG TPA: carbohydrate ABC transporter permease [Spirochaetia bacterium]|nr:carbohydrate ABC transporter permease [Spirochaetia bacterium]